MQNNFKNSDKNDQPTRDFDAVSPSGKQSDGSTRTFDSIEQNNEKDKKAPEQKKGDSKTARAAKATASGVWFATRKVLTYMLNIFLTLLVVGIITGSVVVVAFVVYIKNYVDPNYTGLDNLKFDSALSTTTYYVDKDGNEVLLENDTLESSENRLWAEYSDIPQDLIDAYIAVEDMRFLEHPGVDLTRTASAIYNFFIPTSSSYGGGSTITQQLIKNVSGENEATIQRKVQEIFRAINVEKKYTKEEILEMYLNTIYLSHNSYGVRVAAETYFAKSLDELTLAECASIASIGKWPTHYDPISNPQNNLTRRNLVLKLMLEQGKITEEEFNEAYDAPIRLADGSTDEYSENVHSYYIDAVMDDVVADLMEEYGYDKATASRVLYSGGLEIITCLDPEIQACLEKVYTDSSYWPETKGMQAQSAMCIMDPESGDIVALVGGLGEKRESRGLNRATHSYRQCGSSIKPLSVYALALDSGYLKPGSPVDDVPPVYYENTGKYWPPNSDKKYRGRVSLDYAILKSLNTVAVDTCLALGIEDVYQNFKNYGYTTLVDSMYKNGNYFSDINTSPMALGGMTLGVTVREHTQAYATLANKGVTSESRTYSLVRDSKGSIILDNKESHDVKYKEDSMAILTELLTHVITNSNGTGYSRITFQKNFDVEVAGKTGTTNDKKDVYFCGYTPDYVACCWYGYDNNKVITSSGNPAATLWNKVFNEIYSYLKTEGIDYTKDFPVPSSIVTDVEYCTLSGKKPTEACRNDLYHLNGGMSCIAKGSFYSYDVPTEYCDSHVLCKWDKTTKALCLDGCTCPEADIISVGLRKLTLEDRALHGKVKVLDAQYTYMEVGEDYVYPTSKSVPFFQNLLTGGLNFGNSGASKPANRICIEHYHPETIVDPEVPDPEMPDPDIPDPDIPDPNEPDIPAVE